MPQRHHRPSRNIDVASGSNNQRSRSELEHLKNQERAYIAASRRSDRSLEARVQSARMASGIHKKRTGKSFRVSELIVVKEEMYEEEEGNFPRSYRILRPQMYNSSNTTSRTENISFNQTSVNNMVLASEKDWRGNDVNKAFAQCFPDAICQANSILQHWSNATMFGLPGMNYGPLLESSNTPSGFPHTLDSQEQKCDSGEHHQPPVVRPQSEPNQDHEPETPPGLTSGSEVSSESPCSHESTLCEDTIQPSVLTNSGFDGSELAPHVPMLDVDDEGLYDPLLNQQHTVDETSNDSNWFPMCDGATDGSDSCGGPFICPL